jgi:hypothetical protein
MKRFAKTIQKDKYFKKLIEGIIQNITKEKFDDFCKKRTEEGFVKEIFEYLQSIKYYIENFEEFKDEFEKFDEFYPLKADREFEAYLRTLIRKLLFKLGRLYSLCKGIIKNDDETGKLRCLEIIEDIQNLCKGENTFKGILNSSIEDFIPKPPEKTQTKPTTKLHLILNFLKSL